MSHKWLFLPVFVLGLLCAAAGTEAQDRDSRDGARSLLGSWMVTATSATFSVCNGPSIPAPPPFTELVTYTAGGGFLETNSHLNWNLGPLSSTLVANASDGFGTWKGTEGGVKLKFRKMLFDAKGTYIANVDISEVVASERDDRFSGTFALSFNFLDGSAPLCATGNVIGVAIRPE